ncbi:MAG: FAD-binding protein [Desulfomonile tiedjei]|uniref:FAD-binding protein n=1 Tax=Desulfomonile tiedjei TaxID=2358 RepID=A0A9D6V3U9_9BACT|nr:FAD-binding protein [Desulfomonile tiedjei]
MGYPQELMDVIKRVEKTRPARVAKKKAGEEFPALTLDQRKDRLEKYHPDFRSGALREVKVGPSKGYALAQEIADTFEARSRVDPDKIDLNEIHYETDVLVIGGGGAGTAAALLAQEQGARVIIATKLRHGDANTMMAEGGIQAATKGWKDSPYYHYLDVMGGGHFENDPELVKTMVTEAPKAIAWLEKLGCMFNKWQDGKLFTLHGAGTCRKRMHYAGDMTGAEIMRVLRDECRNRIKDIGVLEFVPAVELLLDDKGKCSGAVLYNLETEEYFLVKAKAVVMATGGSGRLHMMGFMTTNHYGATGDGLVMGYRAGVGVRFLHATQYHPTGAVFPEQAEGLLITEKVRGAGANLVNIEGEQFVFEREPRDIESSSIIRECTKVGKGVRVPGPLEKYGVWLDSPMIDLLEGEGTVEREFPAKFILFKRYGIDISKLPMLIYPTLHYQNGGLAYSSNGDTELPGFYVAGEVGGGVHGANRLMGNSLLDITVFGRLAGTSAGKYAAERNEIGKLSVDHVRKYHKELEDSGIVTDRVSPMVLPDYGNPEVRKRQWTTTYVGTLR